ncbi:hypothetical protein ACH5RR_028673 [Cinchona calisaya]|uniref:O-methyltransferase C-terminal domain-containing protein n=1 Tax=Cinchona calisaya TaxID=153742 RepID=A0ABD2YSS6_9GENT
MAIKQWILHDWSDEECVKILKNCKEAIPSKDKGGKVIIIDMVMKNRPEGDDSDDKAIETQLFFDMLMMVLTKGRERNEKEWAKLFFEAGFSGYKINPVFGLRSLIEVSGFPSVVPWDFHQFKNHSGNWFWPRSEGLRTLRIWAEQCV